jgi:hypothetical protein
MAHSDTFVVRDRRPGYLRVYNDLYDNYGTQLGPYGLAVYVALCRYANQDSECWPSFATIAKGTGMSRRKVIYEIQKLERLGIIAVDRLPRKPSTFILLDTSAQHAPPLVHSMHHPSAQHAPKQSLIIKIPTGNRNKKDAGKNYRPSEYADVII